MNGTYVKQRLRYYKLLFESLLRTKVAYIEDVSARAPQSATETYVGTNHTTLGMESGNNTDSLPEMEIVDDISILLRERNPAAHQYMSEGGFSGSISGEKHTNIPMDQIIEMT